MADIKEIVENKDLYLIFQIQFFFSFFNVKDFTFYKYICEIYILADINELVENQDLCRNKEDF